MKLYHNLLNEYDKKQMGYAPIAIIGQSCIGSVAAMLILMSEASKVTLLAQLFLVTILCMCFNGAILAQQKTKIVVNLLIASIAISLIVIVLNLI